MEARFHKTGLNVVQLLREIRVSEGDAAVVDGVYGLRQVSPLVSVQRKMVVDVRTLDVVWRFVGVLVKSRVAGMDFEHQ